MSQKDNFAGGFLLGTLVGGVVGGVLGAVIASRQEDDYLGGEEKKSLLKSSKQPKLNTEEGMEMARHSLEDKIAQLNLAIDDVRQRLGEVNGNNND